MSGPMSATTKERLLGLGVLEQAPYAYMAVVDDDRPWVVPVNFAYDSETDRLYLHTGPGRKSAALTMNPRVCLSVAVDTAFEPGATPCSDGFVFRSVVLEGTATLLADPEEREEALRAIVARYDPAAAREPFDAGVFSQTLVYAVAIETVGYRESPQSESDVTS